MVTAIDFHAFDVASHAHIAAVGKFWTRFVRRILCHELGRSRLCSRSFGFSRNFNALENQPQLTVVMRLVGCFGLHNLADDSTVYWQNQLVCWRIQRLGHNGLNTSSPPRRGGANFAERARPER